MEAVTEHKVRPRRWWLYLSIAALLCLAAYLIFPRVTKGQSNTAGAKTGGKGKAGAGPRVTPVAAATARTGNLNIFVIGLGNVTAYNTVNLRARVDGQIMKVYFREGQMVPQVSI